MIKQGGIFSSTTVNYVIETQPMGWKVQRTYADCLWLREQLLKFFPGFVVPPLSKKGAKNETDTKSINKRSLWLQQFFSELQRDKTLRSSDVFYCFFSLPQKPQFESRKKEMTKWPAPKSLLDLKHLTGKVQIGMSERKLKLAKNVNSYTLSCQSLYSQLLVATDSTTKVMMLLSDSLARNADLYKQFALLHAGVEVRLRCECNARDVERGNGRLVHHNEGSQRLVKRDILQTGIRYAGQDGRVLPILC